MDHGPWTANDLVKMKSWMVVLEYGPPQVLPPYYSSRFLFFFFKISIIKKIFFIRIDISNIKYNVQDQNQTKRKFSRAKTGSGLRKARPIIRPVQLYYNIVTVN